ncbi:DUF6825 family protein [Candidatus Atelocyanobacterium thalassae]|uniref:Thylakoid lumen protein n=1 Tax=Atelocyanobacterium thalassa (isolate ALOHA) TaxID=1453429 RepID=D3EPU0_ATETH|nr:hypothetical protein [Candidatus Atelocyanobacterium thalassa]ADB95490.1 hypothetical protein UCYN_07980 [Candidatus Atelocyanobacterium thalassa isolate ALOHA]MCH2543924.1 hypothetical protein [Candidatus Atelocyanobacterium sp. ALOHA_A2.5_9]|tara:strand:- start:901 stop:1206 length:306 start_codon:yes stop_codon:yes gene_type:complete
MNNSVLNAFFLGRAFAEVLSEKIEESLTNTLSELSKLNAEQKEILNDFVQEVQTRAKTNFTQDDFSNATVNDFSSIDLQETIDDLRAEIARLKVELKNYQN